MYHGIILVVLFVCPEVNICLVWHVLSVVEVLQHSHACQWYGRCGMGLIHNKKGEPSWSLVFAKLTHKLKVAIEPTVPYRTSSCWYLSHTMGNTLSEAICE